MAEILEDYKIRVFKEEDGNLADMEDHYPSDFGYLVPTIGDEIPCPMLWIGNVDNYNLNGFLVVKRRVFLYAERQIVLICNYRNATPHDRNIF